MANKNEILELAIAVLRRGEPLTLDAVAKEVGLTKAGLVHHFRTKEVLAEAVVDRIAEHWEDDMRAQTADDSTAEGRLRAYVDYAMTGTFDYSDLALIADMRLRDQLCRRWVERLGPRFGLDINGSLERRARLRAARIMADGAWFAKALGIPTAHAGEEQAVREVALSLLDSQGD